MDYTKIPRKLIYKERLSLEDFGVYENHKINKCIANVLRRFSFISGNKAEYNALTCMNNAYYICTMALLEKDPVWRISEYEDISELVKYNNNWKHEMGQLTISMVYLYLCCLPEKIGSHLKDLCEELKEHVNTSYFELLTEDLDDDAELPPNEFAPRIIDKEAIRDLEYPGFQWYHITGFKEKIMREIVENIGKTETEKYLIIDSFRRSSSWKSVFDEDRQYPPELSKTLDTMMMDYCPKIYEINNTKSPASLSSEEEKTRRLDDTTNRDYHIAELEQENEELKSKIEILQNENKRMDAYDVKEEMIIELLTHIFYDNKQNAKDFLLKIKGKSDVEITDLVHKGVKERVISSKSYKRDLWRILHAAKIYNATESNWNTVLRTHSND